MSCDNKKGSGNAAAEFSQGNQIELAKIQEPTGFTSVILDNPYAASEALLRRGGYVIRGVMEAGSASGTFIQNRLITVPIDGEQKRVFLHKIDISEPEMIQGRKSSRLTLVVTVIDNPVPVVPIVYGVSAIGTLVAGWFFVDKVEQFTETGTGQVLSIGAAALLGLGAAILVRVLWR